MSWVYIQSEKGSDYGPGGVDLFTVGHYAPDGTWHAESDHETAEAAAKRVHYLSGGRKMSALDEARASGDGSVRP